MSLFTRIGYLPHYAFEITPLTLMFAPVTLVRKFALSSLPMSDTDTAIRERVEMGFLCVGNTSELRG